MMGGPDGCWAAAALVPMATVGAASRCGAPWSVISTLLDGKAADNDSGDDRKGQHDHHQCQCRAPRTSLGRRERLAGVTEDLRGQRGVLPVEEVTVHAEGDADGR